MQNPTAQTQITNPMQYGNQTHNYKSQTLCNLQPNHLQYNNNVNNNASTQRTNYKQMKISVEDLALV